MSPREPSGAFEIEPTTGLHVMLARVEERQTHAAAQLEELGDELGKISARVGEVEKTLGKWAAWGTAAGVALGALIRLAEKLLLGGTP